MFIVNKSSYKYYSNHRNQNVSISADYYALFNTCQMGGVPRITPQKKSFRCVHNKKFFLTVKCRRNPGNLPMGNTLGHNYKGSLVISSGSKIFTRVGQAANSNFKEKSMATMFTLRPRGTGPLGPLISAYGYVSVVSQGNITG